VGRVDFVYPDARLIVEVDGRRFHGPETFESDRRRDNAAQLVGWRVLRFTWRMVTEQPEYVVSSIRRALCQTLVLR
jgi:very-short-patch-repair endonuclease